MRMAMLLSETGMPEAKEAAILAMSKQVESPAAVHALHALLQGENAMNQQLFSALQQHLSALIAQASLAPAASLVATLPALLAAYETQLKEYLEKPATLLRNRAQFALDTRSLSSYLSSLIQSPHVKKDPSRAAIQHLAAQTLSLLQPLSENLAGQALLGSDTSSYQYWQIPYPGGAENLASHCDLLVEKDRARGTEEDKKNPHKLILRMDTIHLGELLVAVEVQGGEVKTCFHSEFQTVRQYIQSNEPMLRKGLHQKNMALKCLTTAHHVASLKALILAEKLFVSGTNRVKVEI